MDMAGQEAEAKPALKTRSAAAAAPPQPEAPPVQRPHPEALADWQLACTAWLQHVEDLLKHGTAKVRAHGNQRSIHAPDCLCI